MTTARFSINDSPSSERKYDATPGETLTIQLEDLPATDVYKVAIDVVSKDAQAETLAVTQPSPPTAPVEIDMPSGTRARLWLLRVQLNDGKRILPGGRIEYPPDWTFTRAIAIRNPSDLRKVAPGETTEYTFPEGHYEAFNETVDAVDDLALSGVPPNITNNESITGPGDIEVLADTLILFGETAAQLQSDGYVQIASGAASIIVDSATGEVSVVASDMTLNGVPIGVGGGGSSITNAGSSLGIDGSGNLASDLVEDATIEALQTALFFGNDATVIGGGLGATSIAGSSITATTSGNAELSGTTGGLLLSGANGFTVGPAEADIYHETGPVNIQAFDGEAALTLDSTQSYLSNTGTLGISAKGLTLASVSPSGNSRPLPFLELAADASASGTGGNTVGGHRMTRLGSGKMPGTDAPGSWFIGVGTLVSGAAPGLVFGHGASSGTPGTDAYRPFTTEVGRIGVDASEFRVSSVGPLTVRGGVGGSYDSYFTIGGDPAGYGWYGGLLGAWYQSISTSQTWVVGAGISYRASGGNWEVDASSAVRLYSRSLRVIEIGDSSVDRIYTRFPADTATTDATLTTLASFVPTARPSTYKINVHAWDASLNVARWTVEESAVLRSGAADFVGGAALATYPLAPVVSDAALSTARFTVDKNSTTIRTRGAGVAATNLTWSVTVPHEVK